jgi:hypothetical protein
MSSPHGTPHFKSGKPMPRSMIIILALICINFYFNNIILKIVFAGIFWGVWAIVLYALILRPIYNLILKLINK